MNGLFAYADKDSPNTIKLISIDDIIANVQNNDIIDWSDRVILNDFHRVDMPDASIFTIDDLAHIFHQQHRGTAHIVGKHGQGSVLFRAVLGTHEGITGKSFHFVFSFAVWSQMAKNGSERSA